MLTVNKELQQLTLFHDETIGKTWAKAVVICTEMSLELYRVSNFLSLSHRQKVQSEYLGS